MLKSHLLSINFYIKHVLLNTTFYTYIKIVYIFFLFKIENNAIYKDRHKNEIFIK